MLKVFILILSKAKLRTDEVFYHRIHKDEDLKNKEVFLIQKRIFSICLLLIT